MGTVFISEDASTSLKRYLRDEGHKVIQILNSDIVYPAISSHPDIYMCKIGERLFVDNAVITDCHTYRPTVSNFEITSETPISDSQIFNSCNKYITFAGSNIGYKYPENIAYNAISIRNIFIHNLKYTAPSLLAAAKESGLHLIDVKQGYTKCSCVTVGNNAIITYDKGIAAAVNSYNMLPISTEPSTSIDVLLIEKGHVQLSGFEYGFLGGASGQINDKIFFNGDLNLHPDAKHIKKFIEDHNFHTVSFPDEPLTDIGSIIYLP